MGEGKPISGRQRKREKAEALKKELFRRSRSAGMKLAG
jgi:hypothetical protein